MKAIVTVKIKAQSNHNPSVKQTRKCPIGENIGKLCTDTTGGHHSFIEEGSGIFEIRGKVHRRGYHITRIEEIDNE